jgi:TRAP-type C4-dicarboxylate transport system permease large subunit
VVSRPSRATTYGGFTTPHGLSILIGQAVFKVSLSNLYPGLVPFIAISIAVLMVLM